MTVTSRNETRVLLDALRPMAPGSPAGRLVRGRMLRTALSI